MAVAWFSHSGRFQRSQAARAHGLAKLGTLLLCDSLQQASVHISEDPELVQLLHSSLQHSGSSVGLNLHLTWFIHREGFIPTDGAHDLPGHILRHAYRAVTSEGLNVCRNESYGEREIGWGAHGKVVRLRLITCSLTGQPTIGYLHLWGKTTNKLTAKPSSFLNRRCRVSILNLYDMGFTAGVFTVPLVCGGQKTISNIHKSSCIGCIVIPSPGSSSGTESVSKRSKRSKLQWDPRRVRAHTPGFPWPHRPSIGSPPAKFRNRDVFRLPKCGEIPSLECIWILLGSRCFGLPNILETPLCPWTNSFGEKCHSFLAVRFLTT